MSSGPSNFTRSKVNYTDLSVDELQFSSLHPKPPQGQLNQRQSSIFPPLQNLKQEGKLLASMTIDIDLSESQQQEQMAEQQLEFECNKQLSQLGPALAAVKQIEGQLVDKISTYSGATGGVDHWLSSVELIFSKLNYSRLCWPDLAAKYLSSDLIDLWYNKRKLLINNDWDKFRQQLIQHVEGPDDKKGILATNLTQDQAQQEKTTTSIPTTSAAIKQEEKHEAFVRTNFKKFLGKDEAPQNWLAQTINKFEELKIIESSWMSYVPLLLLDKARIWYVMNKSKILDFESFVTKFMEEFNIKSDSAIGMDGANVTTTFKTLNNKAQQNSIEINLIKSLNEQVIRKLKTFNGKNDDVISWIDELESQFNAHEWSQEVKLKCIPTLLHDLALKWYNRNSSTIKSWSDFVIKVKEEFGSKFRQQEAFEKLQNYHQTINQSVTEYYNGLLQICCQLDPVPSDGQILQYLISNIKPSLKIKIMEKQRTTVVEFLNYARISEHLEKLVNEHETFVLSNQSKAPTYTSAPDKFQQQYRRNHNNYYHQTSKPWNVHSSSSNYNPYYRQNPTQSRSLENYSGCFICESKGHYSRNCPERQDFM